MSEFVAVAIDGPSGAGKSTAAKNLAKKMGYIYVDTGAIYRTVGLAAQYANVDSKDTAGVIALLPGIQIDIDYDADGTQMMLLNGQNVSKEIRTPRSSIYASDVSAIPEVRAFLMDMQRDMAKKHDVIMDGRDIGTVVLPDAQVKIFLTASAEERAMRRWRELQAKGAPDTFEQVLADLKQRDDQDMNRAVTPLRCAEDAITVDTTHLSFDETVETILKIVEEASQ